MQFVQISSLVVFPIVSNCSHLNADGYSLERFASETGRSYVKLSSSIFLTNHIFSMFQRKNIKTLRCFMRKWMVLKRTNIIQFFIKIKHSSMYMIEHSWNHLEPTNYHTCQIIPQQSPDNLRKGFGLDTRDGPVIDTRIDLTKNRSAEQKVQMHYKKMEDNGITSFLSVSFCYSAG